MLHVGIPVTDWGVVGAGELGLLSCGRCAWSGILRCDWWVGVDILVYGCPGPGFPSRVERQVVFQSMTVSLLAFVLERVAYPVIARVWPVTVGASVLVSLGGTSFSFTGLGTSAAMGLLRFA